MKENKIEFTYQVFKTEDLSAGDARLRSLAIEAAQKAYAPYSKFSVGAAVLLDNGDYAKGSNQENAAYPSGLCAERVALFSVGANSPDVPVKALAIVAIKDGEIQPVVSPCGGCRQVMLEMEQRHNSNMRVLMIGCNDVIIVSSAKDLLPFCFGNDNL